MIRWSNLIRVVTVQDQRAMGYLMIMKPLGKKAKYQYGGMNGGSSDTGLHSYPTQKMDVFSTSTSTLSVHDELFSLRQANWAIHIYTLYFCMLAASSSWNEVTLLSAYRRGLNPKIRQQMAIYDESMGLELFMLKAQHISRCLFMVSIEEGTPSDTSSSCSSTAPEPMQMDQYRLLANKRQCRLHQRLCLYHGENDHLLKTCPARPPRPMVSTIHISSTVATPRYHDAVLIHASRSFSVKVLFDSGPSGNFISSHLLSACKVPCQRNPTWVYWITTIQGKPLGKGLVQWKTPELTLQIGCLHEETLSLLVLEESAVDVVLGRPWLAKHQPNISQMAAMKLPPHRPWDCAIDLLPGAKLPEGRVYPLSIPENKAMEEYISKALQQGFIQPSTSPAASSFFFVAKKDGGLRPCIDNHVLNSQTVKFAYPLLLVPVALEELCGAHIFSKLDLHNHIKQVLHRFRHYHLYLKLEKWYSDLTAPLTSLLCKKPKNLSWTSGAIEAFRKLKAAFCTAATLVHANPTWPFIVEVDASALGVGAVLSQWSGETPVLHPCAYFSKKLSLAEQNYDIGNRELLAIKLALEEWRHLLEGANHPFEVITDHKNLQCLREAKRLNPRQARIHSPDPMPEEPEPILPPELFVCPITWSLDDDIRAATKEEPAPPGGPDGSGQSDVRRFRWMSAAMMHLSIIQVTRSGSPLEPSTSSSPARS
ncbi:hypothetical protein QTP86_026364 [Hemibagrus guttatus]|nr:hypothetical protein QTP86_026364 [Hemibagrus guttatus]